MKAAEMYCVEASDAQQNKALSKQSLSSLADGGSTHFFRLHLWVRDARRVATYILQDAGCAGHTPATHDALLHTPPQVDISACSSIRKKTRTYAVRKWGTFSLIAISRALPISPFSSSKKAIAQSPQRFAAYYDKRDATRLFDWVARGHADRATCPTCISPLLCEQISLLWYAGPTDVQMYFSPFNKKRRTTSHLVFALPDRIIFEGERKKDGKQQKPGKPDKPGKHDGTDKPKIRKQKPGREGDKEKQEENDPRTEGPMLSITRRPASSHYKS